MSAHDDYMDPQGEAEQRLARSLPDEFERGRFCKVANWSDKTPTAEVLAKLRAVALGHA